MAGHCSWCKEEFHPPNTPPSLPILQPDGWALFTTINRTFLSYLLAIVAAEYVLRMVPRGAHTWEKFVPPAKLSQCLHECGMRVDFCRGMMLNPLTLGWTWTDDTSINYALRATKARGEGQGNH